MRVMSPSTWSRRRDCASAMTTEFRAACRAPSSCGRADVERRGDDPRCCCESADLVLAAAPPPPAAAGVGRRGRNSCRAADADEYMSLIAGLAPATASLSRPGRTTKSPGSTFNSSVEGVARGHLNIAFLLSNIFNVFSSPLTDTPARDSALRSRPPPRLDEDFLDRDAVVSRPGLRSRPSARSSSTRHRIRRPGHALAGRRLEREAIEAVLSTLAAGVSPRRRLTSVTGVSGITVSVSTICRVRGRRRGDATSVPLRPRCRRRPRSSAAGGRCRPGSGTRAPTASRRGGRRPRA